MKDAETGQRGYLLTGDKRYLEPYHAAVKVIRQEVQKLGHSNAEISQKQLDTLEFFMSEKLHELEQTIALRQNKGMAAALQVVQSNKGRNLMDNIRAHIREMEKQETQLWQQQAASAQASAHKTIFTFSAGMLLIFFILAAVYYLIYQENSKRQLVQTALEQERVFTAAVLNTAGALVVVLDPQGKIIRFNAACEQITGYSFDEVKGKLIWEVFSTSEAVQTVFAELLAGQSSSSQHESHWLTKQGERRLFTWSNTLLYDKEGAVNYVICTGIDITERQRVEQVLRESEERFQAFMNNSPAVAFMKDEAGRFVYVNEPFERHFGIQLGNLLGKTDFDLFPTAVATSLRENDIAVLAGEKTKELIESVPSPEGLLHHWLVFKFPCYKATGQRLLGGVAVDITERKQAEEALQQANEKLTKWVNELEQRNHEITLLGEMSDVLQSCLTLEEAFAAFTVALQTLFPETSGGIFLINASKNLVEAATTWGCLPLSSQELFTPHDCWALRRGRPHWIERGHSKILCKHVHHDLLAAESLCVPLIAQGETLGALYLSSQEFGQLTKNKQQLASTVAEHISLSLANLKLRETLRNQSIRDPLTGLFNRRYLEESLDREVKRAERKQQPLGIIMLDVDHFKRFNDTFGHEAGDAVLRELGLFLQNSIRKSDIACRYGGEELTLILPEASLSVVQQRAEQLRQAVKHLHVQHRYQRLDVVTLSLGVACFPNHGTTGEEVIRAADAALYRAKKEGRDRVAIAS